MPDSESVGQPAGKKVKEGAKDDGEDVWTLHKFVGGEDGEGRSPKQSVKILN